MCSRELFDSLYFCPIGMLPAEGTLILYDVTSTYFEGETCPLAQYGYSRDKKKGKLQIIFGLLCNASGCPIAVEVFEGNVGEVACIFMSIGLLCGMAYATKVSAIVI